MEKFQHKKSLGQHFLTSPIIPRVMVDAALLSPNETVLEIGPGTGALTRELLKRGVQVVAVEADKRAIEILEDTFDAEIDSKQLTLHHLDVRHLDLAALGLEDKSYKVVANIPYYLSGFLFRTLLESIPQPTTIVFLVQKEVAKRIVTSVQTGGKESLLSLSVSVYGTPRYVRTVSRGHFTPPPMVDSAIIAIYDINRQHFNELSTEYFFSLLHTGFGSKRKQLLGNLSRLYSRDTLIHIFSTVNIPVDVRAEDVPLEKWLHLATLLSRS